MKRTLTAIVALLAGASVACAADLGSTKDPLPTSVKGQNWLNGCYLSASVGAGVTSSSAAGSDFAYTGALGDARFGCDYRGQGSSVVIGAFGGVSVEDVKGKLTAINTANQTFGYGFGGRVGYKFNRDSMLYLMGEWRGQHIGINNTGWADDIHGWGEGIGLESDLSNGLFFKAEFERIAWQNFKVGTTNLDNTEYRPMAGVGYRF